MKPAPDKCPFCESPSRVNNGIPIRSEDGRFASYQCKTAYDVDWDDQWRHEGQSDLCRKREIQLLTKQRDEARERIKRLEEAGDAHMEWVPVSFQSAWHKAKEAKP